MHRPIISQDQKRERGTGSDNYKASVSPRQEPPAAIVKRTMAFNVRARSANQARVEVRCPARSTARSTICP